MLLIVHRLHNLPEHIAVIFLKLEVWYTILIFNIYNVKVNQG